MLQSFLILLEHMLIPVYPINQYNINNNININKIFIILIKDFFYKNKLTCNITGSACICIGVGYTYPQFFILFNKVSSTLYSVFNSSKSNINLGTRVPVTDIRFKFLK